MSRFKNRLKTKIGKFFGYEPYVKLSLIERNLREIGYSRIDAKIIISSYRKARKMCLYI